MKLSDFDYELPDELIAQYPAPRRDESRLILFDRRTGGIRETRFTNFPRYLQEGDILVVNETRVIPARLYGKKKTGAEVEIFLTRRIGGGRWLAMLRPAKRLRAGDVILVGDERHPVVVGEMAGSREWRVTLPDSVPEEELLDTHGRVPLPPYIKRDGDIRDRERYQTVFAKRDGSVAAPTAGLHFTGDILRDLSHRGITILPLTLHIGTGTFGPLENETVENNVLSPEFVMIRKDFWAEIKDARGLGRRIISVGTTTTRALESLAAGLIEEPQEKIVEGQPHIAGWTDLFIYPGFDFRIIDALVTNMHLPRSSLFILVAAFAGRDEIMRVYHWAIGRRFRFYSYGDVMFIR